MSSKLIDHNPSWKKPVLAVLPLCGDEPASRVAVENAAMRVWEPSYPQAPSSVIDALVREGCLTERITVNGEPYNGSLEDVYRDDAVPDDADVDALLTLADAGRQVMSEYAPAATLAALISDKPCYGSVFLAMLRAASASDGADRAQMEFVIESAISRESITGAGGQKIYPQYFLDALETAGGIAWEGLWRVTPEGAALIGQS